MNYFRELLLEYILGKVIGIGSIAFATGDEEIGINISRNPYGGTPWSDALLIEVFFNEIPDNFELLITLVDANTDELVKTRDFRRDPELPHRFYFFSGAITQEKQLKITVRG